MHVDHVREAAQLVQAGERLASFESPFDACGERNADADEDEVLDAVLEDVEPSVLSVTSSRASSLMPRPSKRSSTPRAPSSRLHGSSRYDLEHS
jgi:hypothetical protein